MNASSFSRCFLSVVLALALVLVVGSCGHDSEPGAAANGVPHIRVRLLQDVDHIDVVTTQRPSFSYQDNPANERLLDFPPNKPITISLNQEAKWKIGVTPLASGVMIFRPGADGTAKINGHAYHGVFKLYATGGGKFDVINDVDIDGYLKGVVAKEMLANWELEAYKAQAVAARTYALYEAQKDGLKRYWDVYPDTRSQVYGGIDGETARSRQAVEETAGIVLVYGPGTGTIFKAYFSSCCGGVSQAAADVFPGDPYIQPLSAQNHGAECNQSSWFNWGPIVMPENEVRRRIRLWGAKRGRVEANLPALARIDIAAANPYRRPIKFVITDSNGVQYTLGCEDFRAAVDTDAPVGSTLPSSFCRVSVDTHANSVTFYDGHGFGHGVGMCQYCAQAKALKGETHEQILAEAYPGSRRVRGY